MGAVIASKGVYALKAAGLQKIVLSLILSPVIALASGYIIMVILLWMFGRFNSQCSQYGLSADPVVSANLMAFSHGSNDAQKYGDYYLGALEFRAD